MGLRRGGSYGFFYWDEKDKDGGGNNFPVNWLFLIA